MLSEELRQLIDASLTDGVLTDKEREVIRKRALLEGVDPDEIDLLLDAEVQKIQQKHEAASPKVKKCPNCGEVIPSMAVKCPTCGYEFREREANKLVERFAEGLKNTKAAGFFNAYTRKSKRADYVKNFALTNNAEDLYDMIIYLTNAIKEDDGSDISLKPALNQKLNECTDRVKVMFPNDPRFENLLVSTKMNFWQRMSSIQRMRAAGIVVIIIMLLLGFATIPAIIKESEKNEQELAQTKKSIENAISTNQLDQAATLLRHINSDDKKDFVDQYQHLINAYVAADNVQGAKNTVNDFGRPSYMSADRLKDVYKAFYAPIYDYYMDKGDQVNAERYSPEAVDKMFTTSTEQDSTKTSPDESSTETPVDGIETEPSDNPDMTDNATDNANTESNSSEEADAAVQEAKSGVKEAYNSMKKKAANATRDAAKKIKDRMEK